MWAIHSLYAPPVETDDQGRYSLNGRDWIKAGIPIHAYPYTPLIHARKRSNGRRKGGRGDGATHSR